jgi:hypothetical protein
VKYPGVKTTRTF